MELYCRESCQNCGELNQVYLGDPEDLSIGDTEGFICYSCGKENLMDIECLEDIYGPEDWPRMLEENSFFYRDGEKP